MQKNESWEVFCKINTFERGFQNGADKSVISRDTRKIRGSRKNGITVEKIKLHGKKRNLEIVSSENI